MVAKSDDTPPARLHDLSPIRLTWPNYAPSSTCAKESRTPNQSPFTVDPNPSDFEGLEEIVSGCRWEVAADGA